MTLVRREMGAISITIPGDCWAADKTPNFDSRKKLEGNSGAGLKTRRKLQKDGKGSFKCHRWLPVRAPRKVDKDALARLAARAVDEGGRGFCFKTVIDVGSDGGGPRTAPGTVGGPRSEAVGGCRVRYSTILSIGEEEGLGGRCAGQGGAPSRLEMDGRSCIRVPVSAAQSDRRLPSTPERASAALGAHFLASMLARRRSAWRAGRIAQSGHSSDSSSGVSGSPVSSSSSSSWSSARRDSSSDYFGSSSEDDETELHRGRVGLDARFGERSGRETEEEEEEEEDPNDCLAPLKPVSTFLGLRRIRRLSQTASSKVREPDASPLHSPTFPLHSVLKTCMGIFFSLSTHLPRERLTKRLWAKRGY